MDQEQFMNLKKFIKEETPRGQRLNSIRLPRDLTLGGPITKQPKKNFVPNLNIVRNKEKAKEIIKKNGFNPKLKDNKSSKRESNAARKGDSGRFVQSSGIFSDGMGNDVKRTSRWSDKRSDKENDGGPSVMTMPSLKKKNWVIDKKAENNVFHDIMGDDDASDELLDEKLPFQPLNWFTVTTKVKKEVKTEDIVPNYSTNSTSIQPDFNKLKIEDTFSNSSEYLDQSYDDNNPALSLWKMPDSLCGKGLSDDPNCKQLFDYCLDNMLEGQIGKLMIRKSGKMEVHIGNAIYQLEHPNHECFTEDIVALDPNSEKGFTATVLAGIRNRYTLSPDWESLLK